MRDILGEAYSNGSFYRRAQTSAETSATTQVAKIMERVRAIFMGSAQLSCPSLQALLDWPQCEVAGVVTQPDRPKGRELKPHPTPVKEIALKANLRVLQPEKARAPEFISEVSSLRPDVILVVAYGQILSKALLELPRFGCLNVHTSLLPRYRGASPIQSAIVQGETETGVTIMKMDEGLDTGPILAQERTPIVAEDDAQTLHDRLAILGATLLIRTVHSYLSGLVHPRPQPEEGASYAPKIKKSDGLIDWSMPATSVWNRVRGLVPWPGAYTFLPATPKPQVIKLWRVEPVSLAGTPGEVIGADRSGILVGAGAGAVRILSLQREGGRRMSAGEFLAGHPIRSGTRLG